MADAIILERRYDLGPRKFMTTCLIMLLDCY